MKDRKIIVIAKCFDSSMSGPANIVRGLIKEFNVEKIPYEAVLLKENTPKFEFLKQLVSALYRNKNSIVNVHTEGFLIPLLVYLCSRVFRSHSYYLTVHGIYQIEAEMSGDSKKIYVFVEKILYKYFPNITCVSEMLKANIAEIYGRKKNVIVIHNATDAESYMIYKRNEPVEMIALGGIRKCKGIDGLLDLAEFLKNNELKFHISIYGVDEGNETGFNEEVIKRQLNDVVDYRGQLNDKQKVYDKLRMADFHLCLSLYDTYNVAIAESLVLGCPCIATDKCGASYLINDGFNGIVVKNDKEEFKRILDFIKKIDDNKRSKMEDESTKYKVELSWEKIANLYFNLG